MRPMGEIDEGAVREEVAERNRRVEEDCSRMRARRGGEMGQALLHLPEEERGDRDPAEGDLRARLLQGRLAQGPETHLDRKSTRLNSSHRTTSYAVFCLKKKMTAMGSPPGCGSQSALSRRITRPAALPASPLRHLLAVGALPPRPRRSSPSTHCRSSATS